MSENIMRNFFVLTVSIYTFCKLLNLKIKPPFFYFKTIVFSLSTSIISTFLFEDNQSLNWIFVLVILILTLKSLFQIRFSIIYTSVLFSFSFSFIAFTLSGIIAVVILLPFFYENYEIPWFIIRLGVGILHYFLIYCRFHLPRLQKGMKFLYHIPSGNIGSTICVFLIMLIIVLSETPNAMESFTIRFASLILFSGFLLIYWWNYHITQTYRRFLRKNEIDSLNLLLEEQKQEIAYLKSENDKLSRLIHKDNKLLPALSLAIMNSYETRTALDFSTLNTDSSIYIKLKQLYAEREKAVATYQQEILRLPQTAFDSVNAILSYMQTESLTQNIPFQVMLFDDLASTIPHEIAEDDFTHMLSDLLSNAIHACKDIPSTSIQVYLGKMNEISTIKILNTGNIFDIGVLRDLGLARHTTHADTGGSGIGLMDIWSIKERYGATLLIDESVTASTTYTCVNILFNHKKHYIIQSNRYKELSSLINRPDIMIISKE